MSYLMSAWPPALIYALAAINFLACSGIAVSCVCRFAVMSKETTPVSWRVRYITVIVAASSSGISPVWGEWPGPGQLLMAAACLYVLGLTAKGWRGAPPTYASKPMPLDDGDLQHVAGGKGAR
jgi:hypothetical protein